MNSTQEEAVSTLLGWAEEDVDSRGLLIIADEEDGTRLVYNGTELNLVAALAVAMRKDDNIRQVCAKAMILLENCEARVTSKQDNDKVRDNGRPI
jgi:hypothetical protein